MLISASQSPPLGSLRHHGNPHSKFKIFLCWLVRTHCYPSPLSLGLIPSEEKSPKLYFGSSWVVCSSSKRVLLARHIAEQEQDHGTPDS